jgi:hypothetical protein
MDMAERHKPGRFVRIAISMAMGSTAQPPEQGRVSREYDTRLHIT